MNVDNKMLFFDLYKSHESLNYSQGSPREWFSKKALYLHKRMVLELTSHPPSSRVRLKAVRQEVLALVRQVLGHGGQASHAHFEHDHEVVLQLVPRPLPSKHVKKPENCKNRLDRKTLY